MGQGAVHVIQTIKRNEKFPPIQCGKSNGRRREMGRSTKKTASPKGGGIRSSTRRVVLERSSVIAKVEGGVGIYLNLARVVPVAFLSCQFGGGGVPLNLTKPDIIIHQIRLEV